MSFKHLFSWINGREVFGEGATRKWRCPECGWWRPWAEEKCIACGKKRDGEPGSTE